MANVLLTINDVVKTYESKQITIEALKGITLDLYEGEIFGLLGVNGAGKTTLSSIIATLIPPTAGDLFMNGISIYDKVLSYRSQLGFCPQKPNFERNLTVRDNLEFAGRFYLMDWDSITRRVDYLLEQFNLTKYASSKPEILSGGFKQRLLLARSLVHSPRLVILDEPTVGLDPHIRRQLWEVIKDLKSEGVTTILTTHYMDEADHLSDRICILDEGCIIAIDTPENLKSEHIEGTDERATLENVFLKLVKES